MKNLSDDEIILLSELARSAFPSSHLQKEINVTSQLHLEGKEGRINEEK